jgi:hypothetical protein
MKKYSKSYEDVFTADHCFNRCKLDKILIDDFESLEEYRNIFGNFIRKSFDDLFSIIIKIVWLRQKFRYFGRKRKSPSSNSMTVDYAFGFFIRHYVGVDIRFLTRYFGFAKIVSYFNDFFPDFEENNPFENPEKYRFPYEHITLDFLFTVYQMDERLKLLNEAEEKKMSYIEFLDHIINYISSRNEELGKEAYRVMMLRSYPPYIKKFI